MEDFLVEITGAALLLEQVGEQPPLLIGHRLRRLTQKDGKLGREEVQPDEHTEDEILA